MKNITTFLCLLFSLTCTQAQTIRAFGDSFTEGIGAASYSAYPNVLSQILSVPVQNFGQGGTTSTQIKDRVIADAAHKNLPTIIWAGYNNYADSATVLADIEASVASLGHNRYLVVGVLNTFQPYEYLGGGGYSIIVGINDRLMQTYGAHYVPMRDVLVNDYNPTIFQDSLSHALDAPAWTLRVDAKHLNAAGYSTVAQKISQYAAILFASPLPVTFTGINGTEKNNGVQITWNVATESNIGRYEVEKSADGRTFTKSGTISPKNNIGNAATYQWFDAAPANNTSFYRIKSVDNNGEIKYSAVVRVNLSKGNIKLNLYPNPVKDLLMTSVVSASDENAVFKIYNSTGSLLKTISQHLVAGTNNFSIDVAKLPAGIYLLEYNKSVSTFLK